jgi:Ca-activated chloride channel family protein
MTRDTDDLARLKAALQQAPASDPAAKMVAMDRAMEAFEKLQGAAQDSAPPPRPTQDRPKRAGILRGVRHMFETLKLKPALAVTTSAAALFVGVVILLPQGGFGPGLSDRAPAPLAVDVAPLVLAEPAPAPLPAPAPAAKMAPAEARSRAQASADMEAPSVEALADYGMAAAESAVVGTINTPQASLPDTTETFANAEANPVRITAAEPVSTFSVDVDTASYAIVRDALMAGTLPDAQAVRVEEMVNYFPYDYPAPDAGTAPFRPSVTVMPTPWNPGTRLVQIALQGRMPAVADRPPLNLVFLIDTSGSMQDADKLPLLKQSLGLMLGQLRAEDQVAIVAYAGSAGQVLPPTPAAERDTILAALDRLEAGGSTAGAEGLELAYRVAETMGGKGEVSRILLATDGDFNVGIDDPEGLEAYVARKRDTGVYLSILGFGRGNLDDAVMQSLAQNGNGTGAYIDTLQEARKVLVDQLTGALFPIADDVKIQVEWNPAAVAEYRLIGYETRALRREDFNNDAVDAGEIGAGHQVTAIYEVTAPGSSALLNDPLRYGAPEASVAPQTQGPELGFLRLRYKAPGEDVSALRETPILADTPVTADARFAAAIAGFGQLLRGSAYLGAWDYAQAIDLASDNRGDDPFGYRIEAVNLMRLAQSLAR